MSELVPGGFHDQVIGGAQRRAVIRAGKEIARDALIAQIKVEGVAAVASRAADRLVDLDRQRELTAGNDVLNQLLIQLEMAFVNKATQIQSRMF